MFRWSVLLVSLLVTGPSLWAALGTQTVSVTSAVIHFLVAVPIVAVLFGLVREAARPAAKPVRRPARNEEPPQPPT